MDPHVWENVSTLLTPWKLAATTVQLQFTLRQTASALMNPTTSASANEILDQLAFSIFRHAMTSEEAYFIAETMKGVDKVVATKVCY
jgi:mediator of RNA polymerase II transcription subunit 12, fungi type